MKTFQYLTRRADIHRFDSGTLAIAAIRGISGIGFSTSFLYLSLYLHQERHVSMTEVGVIWLVMGIVVAIFQILGGVTADRFGYRKMAVIYMSATVLPWIGVALLIGAGAGLWVIVALAVLTQTLSAMASPALMAGIAANSAKGKMTESYSLLAITANIGWAIGPLVGGYLLRITSYAWVFGLGAAISALSLLCTPFLRPGSGQRTSEGFSPRGIRSIVSNPTLIIFSGLSLLFFADLGQWGTTLSVFSVDRIGFTTEQYGLLASISGILIIIFQYPISNRAQRMGDRRALFLGCALLGVGWASLGWVKAFVPALGSVVLLVAGEMLFVPTAQAAIGRLSRPHERGRNMGIYGFASSLGFSVAPLLGGFLLDRYSDSPISLWAIISLCAFVAALGFAVWRWRTPPESTGPSGGSGQSDQP